MIGAGVGAMPGLLLTFGDYNSDTQPSPGVVAAVGAASGAVVGAAIGWVLKSEEWQPADLTAVTGGVTPLPGGGLGVSLRVGWGAQEPSEEPADRDWRAKAEQRILERLNKSTSLTMRCDFVLNARPDAASFTAAIAGRTTVLSFWRPSCGPCKPLLKELASFSRRAPDDVAVLAAAEGGSLYGERVDVVKARELIGSIVKQYGVPFPVCGYTDHAQTKVWQAEGVPLTLFLDRNGRVGRVAMGAVEASSALKQLEAGWRP